VPPLEIWSSTYPWRQCSSVTQAAQPHDQRLVRVPRESHPPGGGSPKIMQPSVARVIRTINVRMTGQRRSSGVNSWSGTEKRCGERRQQLSVDAAARRRQLLQDVDGGRCVRGMRSRIPLQVRTRLPDQTKSRREFDSMGTPSPVFIGSSDHEAHRIARRCRNYDKRFATQVVGALSCVTCPMGRR
jgi:hypothetical protein